MFVNNINPVIVSLGPLSVKWYGLVYVLGFLAAYWWLHYLAKHKKIDHLTPELVEKFVLWLILGVIVGGRFFEFVFFEPHVLLTRPQEILFIWHGGMSFHGGLIGVAFVTWLLCRKHKISLLQLGDALALPAAFTLGLGRIANFVNSELAGKVTNVPWCVEFPRAVDPAHRIGCRHPSQLYESLKNFVTFGILSLVWGWKRKDGLIMWLFIILYGLGRFLTDFYRDDPLVLFRLSMGQLLSLIMFVIGVAVIVVQYWHPWRKGDS